MKGCELCNSPAAIYCDSDQASLCCDCDAKVHSANFLVAKHSRTLLCHVCQSLTPWNGSGPKLGTTISVCQSCMSRSRAGNESPAKDEEGEDDDGDDGEEDGDEEEDEEHDGDGDGDDDNDEDNQVVPWSSTPPPPISCSSTSEEESSSRFGSGEEGRSDSRSSPSLKPMRQQSSSRPTFQVRLSLPFQLHTVFSSIKSPQIPTNSIRRTIPAALLRNHGPTRASS